MVADSIDLELEEVISITEPVISGEQVKEVVLSPWRITVVLRNGKRIVVEPDFYPEIMLCRGGEWDCYVENVKLSINIHMDEER
ncbi:MAG: hypothetical protein QXU08_09070 [Ignisphaera sp.]